VNAADGGVETADERDALAAADAIVDDFGAGRVPQYFSRFAPDATFLFHSTPRRLESRAEYEELWDQWIRESGFAVRSCRSSDRRIQVFRGCAVFTHTVDTVVVIDGAEQSLHERESIVLERRGGEWVCVHEHLSALD
jgi:ketosteroid isomerase-like protein